MRFLIVICILGCYTYCSRAQGYYPLQIGNVWQYQDRWDSIYTFTTRAVAETVMTNGLRYTVLVSDRELDTLYFRQEGLKVYNYTKYRITDSTYWQGEELWYDFSKTQFDTVDVRYYQAIIGGTTYRDTVTITVAYDGYKSVFGKTLRQWGFYEKSQSTSMYAVWEITDSIGEPILKEREMARELDEAAVEPFPLVKKK